MIRFHHGRPRIIDLLRPHPRVVGGMHHYFKARWRLEVRHDHRRIGHKPRPRQTGGWLPGRWRWAGLKPMRRIIDPAVRYEPVTRQYNEILRRRYKQSAYPPDFTWTRRKPIAKDKH